MRKVKSNPDILKKASVLVRSGLTLEKTAQLSGVSVRTIKRYFKSTKSSYNYTQLLRLTKRVILYYTYKGWDFMTISAVLDVPPGKVLAFLDKVRASDVRLVKCNCGITFPVTAQLLSDMCPFCELRQKNEKENNQRDAKEMAC